MKGIKTLEEAQKLPERTNIGYNKEVMNGVKINVPYFREIGAMVLEDGNLLAFVDVDGRRMSVAYDSEGAYKYAL